MLPKISCVIPCLNAERYLARTLRAICAAAGEQDEIIAVYDESGDRTRDILASFAPKVRTIERSAAKPRSPAIAINLGFAESSGDILCWVGADDFVFPWAFETVRSVFAEHPGIQWITSTEPAIIRGMDIEAVTVERIEGFSLDYFLDGFTVPGLRRGAGWIQQESTFWRRELWQKVGGALSERHKFAFDLDLWSRFFEHAEICGVDSLLGAFRYREGQLSGDVSAISSEACEILDAARQLLGWRKSVLRETLLSAGRKHSKLVRSFAMATCPYSWNVAKLKPSDAGTWQVSASKFWPY